MQNYQALGALAAQKQVDAARQGHVHKLVNDERPSQPKRVRRIDNTSKVMDALAEDLKCLIIRDDEEKKARRDALIGVPSYLAFCSETGKMADRIKSRLCIGDKRMEAFLGCFKHFKYKKYSPQMRVVQACLPSLLGQFYGETLDDNIDRIEAKFGFTDRRCSVLVSFPRRTGKTYITAMIEAALLYVLPDGATAIFAAFEFQSCELLNLIYKFYCQLPGAQQRVIRRSRGEFVVAKDADRSMVGASR